ncbi:protein phosphatase PPM2 [Plasmodium berghei]|uniref:protein-serine/threonine phosphatase n=2 Tax=Plasmodium berghei TaxID=5821 RepID=A0A509AHX4_PLABA|nr:protein phosphatase PPM2 [Plasmodium berghei ANKA]SCM21874.1 protein phosphatase PPM2 [Plasmodium berghei]SCN25116.1 protein phosphatase PPM2 [Plasmodium berghei]SCO60131.1 protein phosphatase PPM2 [Plasmodium berghei]SCO61690.1 protein phosphatase PPM2 [Plasmodium berghei]VUC55643.1 protein phosphatase PPM2 [Plasmodium berghei ANKA]|eukprot:XP_034421453.1 protein phosphatase PPM2 [Plasmodium berghei ANKA]
MGAYLSAPKTNKESMDGGNLEIDPSRYGLSCMQGWRKNMEDSHICYNNIKVNEIEEVISIYGVFDGHGGPNVSKWISYNFYRIFVKSIKEASDEMKKDNLDKSENYKLKLIKLTLEKTFLKLDEEMLLTENQEKLKKYNASAQETEESDTKENYLYSILNDIISKNISIKAVEKDGKRCLQVVYNKEGNPVEEGNVETPSTSLIEDDYNNKSEELYDEDDSILKDNMNGDGKELEIKDTDSGKKNDTTTGEVNINDNIKGIKLEKDEKIEDSDNTNKEKNDLENKCKSEVNSVDTDTSTWGQDIKNKIKEDNNGSTEINTKRLKKDMDNETDNNIKEEGTINNNNHNNKTENVKPSALTYDNLKSLGEMTEPEDKLKGNYNNTNDVINDILDSCDDDNSLDLYGKDNIGEGFSYNETITNVIDNNINNSNNNENNNNENNNNENNNSENNNSENNEANDNNDLYSPDELRLFENYYSNDYEDNIAYSCGSTAIVAVILKGYLIVANAGDSRAIICFNGNSLGMSTDHKPHLQAEEARIKKAGGYISNGRVDGNLNLTRAIGDLHYKRDPFLSQKDQKISAFPEVTCVTLTPDDEFLFLACDGIWDCKDGQDVVGFVKARLEKFEELSDNSADLGGNQNTNSEHINSNNNTTNNENSTLKDESNTSNSAENGQISNSYDKNIKNNNSNIENEDNSNENQNKFNENSDTCFEKDTNDKYDDSPIIERKKYDKFNKLSQICEELCDDCLSNNYKENDGIGCDNMTCLIVQYNPLYKMHTEKKFLNIDDIE